MTLYLIDANVLIRAHADYYPIDRVVPFWHWLLSQAEVGAIKTPIEIYNEVAKSSDLLGEWLRLPNVKKAILLAEPTDSTTVNTVIQHGYALDLNDVELLSLTRDPFLVAAAMKGSNRVVVTREASKPKKLRHNRRIPDVCDTLGVPWINDFELWRRLDFRIP